jgi:hypothetical protein
VRLTWLSLRFTNVAGDVHGLAPLVQLTGLLLDHTKVTGQAEALAPLVRLRHLWLGDTAVAGCDAFCEVGGPFHKLEYGPKTPLTAYITYHYERFKADNPTATNTKIISLIGQEWRTLSDSEKQHFEEGTVATDPATVRARVATRCYRDRDYGDCHCS